MPDSTFWKLDSMSFAIGLQKGNFGFLRHGALKELCHWRKKHCCSRKYTFPLTCNLTFEYVANWQNSCLKWIISFFHFIKWVTCMAYITQESWEVILMRKIITHPKGMHPLYTFFLYSKRCGLWGESDSVLAIQNCEKAFDMWTTTCCKQQ